MKYAPFNPQDHALDSNVGQTKAQQKSIRHETDDFWNGYHFGLPLLLTAPVE